MAKYLTGAILLVAALIALGMWVHVPFVLTGLCLVLVLLGYFVLVPRP